MAKQKNMYKLRGTIEDMTFYKRNGKYFAKTKSEIDKQKILTDPAFQRTRENMAEFGFAGKAGKVIRMSVITLLTFVRDSRMIGRLLQALMAIRKTDTTSVRGARKPQLGDLTLLTGFNFNRHAPLSGVFAAPYTTSVDRTTGTLTVDIPSFIPNEQINAPEGTTHFKIAMEGAEVDFDNETYVKDAVITAITPWDSSATLPISQGLSVTAGTVLPLFIHLGVQFFEEINGNYYPLKNDTYNPLGIVKVDQV
jgi:hypothetical protein